MFVKSLMCVSHGRNHGITEDGTELQSARIMPYIHPGLLLFCQRHASRNPKRVQAQCMSSGITTGFLLSKFSAFVQQKRNCG